MRERLCEGEVLIGTSLAVPHPMVVDVLARTDFAYLFIDAEHSPVNRSDIALLVAAADARATPVLVRVPPMDGGWIATALDAGAAGVIVPQIETAEQARAVVDAARFAPLGKRGVGLSRAAGHGTTFQEYLRLANTRTLVVVMIETAKGVENADAIAAVEGIDVIFIGPGDLGFSLGTLGAEDQTPFDDAVARVRSACTRNGRLIGHFHQSADQIAPAIDAGVRLHCIGGDLLYIMHGASALAADIFPGTA